MAGNFFSNILFIYFFELGFGKSTGYLGLCRLLHFYVEIELLNLMELDNDS